jgi:hypothetical protein
MMYCRVLASLLTIACLFGCVKTTVNSTKVPSLQTYDSTLRADEVLDIAVVVFDPGISIADPEEGIYPEVRRAEATFMARELAQVLDNQGVWGASRVVPYKEHITDVLIQGVIEQSDGELLTLAITATDSQGRVWLDKQYTGKTSSFSYEARWWGKRDPFEFIYHNVANDLLAAFRARPRSDRLSIRDVSTLKFAQSFAPEAFDDYLIQDETNLTRTIRLPADSDPMMARIGMIRQRNHIFVDTLQGHYDNFSSAMYAPYNEWRRLSYEEAKALRELRDDAQDQLVTGGVSLLAGVAAATSSSSTTRAAGAIGVFAGGSFIKSGLERRAEANIHSLALEELGQSLESEITPQVISLEDRTIQLSGTIEDQYSQWREILSDIYAAELAELPIENDPLSQ